MCYFSILPEHDVTSALQYTVSNIAYAKTREECEEKLAEMIVQVKAQIKAEKEKLTGCPKKSPCQNLRCCRQRIQSLIKRLIINLIDSFNINNK